MQLAAGCGVGMFKTMKKRSFVALFAVLFGGLAWHIYSGWGLVTIRVNEAPLNKVLESIGKQGSIEIVTNLDPTNKVSLDVYRVTPTEALDIVSVRTDSTWRVGYIGAPAKAAIDAALASFRSGQTAEDWSIYGAGGYGSIQAQSGQALDLRRVEWTPSGGGALHDLLAEASDKTGVLLAAPSDWKPVAKAPKAGPMAQAAPTLFRNAGGVSREVFVLRGESRNNTDAPEGRGRGGSWIGSAARGDRSGGPPRDPQRIAERVEAQIKLLPAAEQEKARAEATEMRNFWQSVRDLPEQERRAKAQEFFNRPDVQERMEDRRLARDAKMTPTQRIDRSRRYWERKVEAKKSGATQ